MIFCEAMRAMKAGNKVTRESWDGKILYWHVPKGSADVVQKGFDEKETIITCIPWKDIRAEDWLIL